MAASFVVVVDRAFVRVLRVVVGFLQVGGFLGAVGFAGGGGVSGTYEYSNVPVRSHGVRYLQLFDLTCKFFGQILKNA